VEFLTKKIKYTVSLVIAVDLMNFLSS